MFCNRCGFDLGTSGGTGVCPQCGQPGAVPPYAGAVPPAGAAGTYGVAGAADGPQRKRSRIGLAVGAVGVVLVLIVGVFVVKGVRGDNAGAATPEKLAEQLSDAIQKKDPAAAIALLDPGEVPQLGAFYEASVDAALRAADGSDDADPDADYDAIRSALDLRVTGLSSEVEYLGSQRNYAKVSFTAGTVDWKTDPSRLPSSIKDRIEKEGGDLGEPESGSGSVDDLRVVDADGDEIDPFLMVVKVDGRWFVSVAMTIGEYAVQVSGARGGDFDDPAVPGDPASSPQDAVQKMIDEAVAKINTGKGTGTSMVGLLPEAQTRVFRVYARAMSGAFDDFATEFDSSGDPDDTGEGFTGMQDVCDDCGIEVSDLKIDVVKDQGATFAVVTSLSLDATYQSCTYDYGYDDEGYDDYYGGDEDLGLFGGDAFSDDGSFDDFGGQGFDVPGENPSTGNDPSTGNGSSSDGNDGDQARSRVTGSIGAPAPDDGCEPVTAKIRWDGSCLTYTVDDPNDPQDDKTCLGDELGDSGISLKDLGITDVRIAVSEERGGWVIDPVATVLDHGQRVISHLNDPKVKAALDN